jgi:hypothetical protein
MPLGEALAEVLRHDGIELFLGVRPAAARREGDEYVLEFDAGDQLRAIACWSPPADGRG